MQYRHVWKHKISVFDVLCLRIADGGITVNSCSEGIESPEILIEDGDITVTSTDDGINACGTETADGSLPGITINGGTVTLLNPSGRDADGIDSNGNIDINGGLVYISLVGDGSNCALDYGSENSGVCRINGGTVVACGGDGDCPASCRRQDASHLRRTQQLLCRAGQLPRDAARQHLHPDPGCHLPGDYPHPGG